MSTFTSRVIEKDGLKFLDITPNYDDYHKGNGGRASQAVQRFKDTHDECNSYNFTAADIADLYGMTLEAGNGSIDFTELIVNAIYAGMCAAEWADEPHEI